MTSYERCLLSPEEEATLLRSYADLKVLSWSSVPAVRAAARSALAQIAQALNGQGLAFELYSREWERESPPVRTE
jgi:hypothetical protein